MNVSGSDVDDEQAVSIKEAARTTSSSKDTIEAGRVLLPFPRSLFICRTVAKDSIERIFPLSAIELFHDFSPGRQLGDDWRRGQSRIRTGAPRDCGSSPVER